MTERIKDYYTLAASIVDLQPAYNLLAVAKGGAHKVERDFARFKIEQAIQEMQEAAKYLKERLEESNDSEG